jgi:hypothetical protein
MEDAYWKAKAILENSSSTSSERIKAVEIFGNYDTPETIKTLISFFELVRKAPSRSEHEPASFLEAMAERCGYKLAQNRNKQGLAYLLQTASSPHSNSKIRASAVLALRDTPRQEVILVLAECLKANDVTVTRATLKATSSIMKHPQSTKRLDLSELRTALYCLAFNPSVLQAISSEAYQLFIGMADEEVIDGLTPLVISNSDDDPRLSANVLKALIDIPGEHSRKRLGELLLANLPEPSWYFLIAKELAKTENSPTKELAEKLSKVSYGKKLFSAMNPKASQILKSKMIASKILLGEIQEEELATLAQSSSEARTRR